MNGDIDKMWEIFEEILKEGQIKYIPQSKPVLLKKQKPIFPFDVNLSEHVHHKRRMWNRFMETRDQNYYSKYKSYRNKVRTVSRRLRREQQENIALTCKGNPKAFWKYINSRTKNRSNMGDLKIIDDQGLNKFLTEDCEKAKALGEFFGSVFTEEGPMGPECKIKIDERVTLMPDINICEEDILLRLSKLDISKSPGPDGLHPRLLYEIRTEIAYPLKILFTASLSTNLVPKDWKFATITAIHKKGSRSDVSNYRPISLTSVLSKLLESIVRDHILDHLLHNNLITNCQYGFVPKRSTSLQLLYALDMWTNYLEEGGQIDIVYTDFE